jgi:hypothetical protein
LLIGVTPFDRKRLRAAAFEELLRIIREEEPPRPSIRLSSHASLPTIAANRNSEPKKLSLLVRGDLDWIVMKALEKDRSRRYETANEFAQDVRCFLSDDVVRARPPSVAYRVRKFARRHRTFFASAVSAFSALLIGLIVTTTALIWAIKAEGRAVSELREKETELAKSHMVSLTQRHQAELLAAFRESTERLLDQITRTVDHDPRADPSFRKDVLMDVKEFWENTIDDDRDRSGNPSYRTRFDRLKIALCLARLGEHQRAFEETEEVRDNADRIGVWSNDFVHDTIRVCALCAAASSEDQALSASYVQSAIEYVRVAADHADIVPPPSNDPDLTTLTSTEEFQAVLHRWRERRREDKSELAKRGKKYQ